MVFQPVFEHRAINAGQREGAGGGEGGPGEGRHNWLLTANSKSERVKATARQEESKQTREERIGRRSRQQM